MLSSVCRCVCLDQPRKLVKYLCRSLTVKTACQCIVFCMFASTRGNWRHTCWAICPVVLDCVAGWPWKTICTECQRLPTHGGEMMCLFLHAMTRLRGADREGTCSCEGAEFLWWCAAWIGKSVVFDCPSEWSLCHFSCTCSTLVVAQHVVIRLAFVSSPLRFHVVCSCYSVYLVFSDALCGTTDQSEEHLDVHRSSLRSVSLAARLPVFVLSLEVLVCTLHFEVGSSRRHAHTCKK